jgi:alginate O-acetyltransferase complex protein AlgI
MPGRAALAYTFPIYFDFSGYSDMAIGLSLMFGIMLPFNFNSPYKATGIIDFWHRWHMTLSLFLRDYVYIPLGGNRRGEVRRYVNILLTMLIGGLWHGANWTFVAWGGLHGIFLLVNHAWRSLRGEREGSRFGQWIARIFTFLLVIIAWVFFRSESFAAARRMFDGMRGLHGWINGPLVEPGAWFAKVLQGGGLPIAEGLPAAGLAQLLWFVVLFAIVWGLPNTQEFLLGEGRPAGARLVWRPTLAWAAGLGLCFGVAFTYSIISVNRVSEFIYFIF